jgi:hypothetical protein
MRRLVPAPGSPGTKLPAIADGWNVSAAQPGVVLTAIASDPRGARRGGHAASAVKGCQQMNRTHGREDGERHVPEADVTAARPAI